MVVMLLVVSELVIILIVVLCVISVFSFCVFFLLGMKYGEISRVLWWVFVSLVESCVIS